MAIINTKYARFRLIGFQSSISFNNLIIALCSLIKYSYFRPAKINYSLRNLLKMACLPDYLFLQNFEFWVEK